MSLNQQIERWLIDQRKHFKYTDRPFVTLSYAQSWDGSITLQSGESLALSSEKSLLLTHQLRSIHDGILVGIGTVLSDDPLLNVRQCAGPDPQPIVLDAHLRIPPAARLCHLSEKRCWVITSSDQTASHHKDLDVIRLPGDQRGRVCLHDALRELKQRGVHSLMVEGGANVITGFLKQKLVDAIVLTVAPRLVGGYKAVADIGFESKAALPQISPMFTGMLDKDLIMWGQLQYNLSDSVTGEQG
jgi:riboflavin-specific deaminase-like protein